MDWALFLSVAMIWGSSFLLIDLGLDDLTPGAVTLLRVGLGAATLLVLGLRDRSGRTAIARQDWPRVVLLSIVWVAVPFTLFPLAQEHINSALTGLLNGATPIFAAVIATLFTGIRPRGAVLLGLVVGFAGVTILSLPSLGPDAGEAKGVFMVLAATVCYGLAMNLAAPLQRRYGAIALMTPILCLATLFLIPIGLRDFDDNVWAAPSLVPVAALGVVGTGLAYWIMATLVGRVGPVRASFITYLIPVVSLILGVAVRGDRVAALALAGAAITTIGASLASGRVSLRSIR